MLRQKEEELAAQQRAHTRGVAEKNQEHQVLEKQLMAAHVQQQEELNAQEEALKARREAFEQEKDKETQAWKDSESKREKWAQVQREEEERLDQRNKDMNEVS